MRCNFVLNNLELTNRIFIPLTLHIIIHTFNISNQLMIKFLFIKVKLYCQIEKDSERIKNFYMSLFYLTLTFRLRDFMRFIFQKILSRCMTSKSPHDSISAIRPSATGPVVISFALILLIFLFCEFPYQLCEWKFYQVRIKSFLYHHRHKL